MKRGFDHERSPRALNAVTRKKSSQAITRPPQIRLRSRPSNGAHFLGDVTNVCEFKRRCALFSDGHAVAVVKPKSRDNFAAVSFPNGFELGSAIGGAWIDASVESSCSRVFDEDIDLSRAELRVARKGVSAVFDTDRLPRTFGAPLGLDDGEPKNLAEHLLFAKTLHADGERTVTRRASARGHSQDGRQR